MIKKLLFTILLFSINAHSQIKTGNYEVYTLPKVTGIVNDFEDILQPDEEEILAKMLQEYEQKTTNEIVIVTIATIGTFDSMFDFSLKLAQRTGIGKAGKDNGIMIVVSKKLRQMQIQNGDGIIQKLSTEATKAIIDRIMIPHFKKDNYFEGIKKGILEIENKLD